MVVDGSLVGISASSYLPHGRAIIALFGEYVRGLIKQCLTGEFGRFHDQSFFAIEVAELPTDTTARYSSIHRRTIFACGKKRRPQRLPQTCTIQVSRVSWSRRERRSRRGAI